ncbi:MAG: type I DNA topoisomerase [Candidatus Latescibacter sp.]|nr:type I DNA topoisomerase [Candidatus Latescibacter sp.]
MGKFLVIVESPVKAKTINKFLGHDYIVKPTGGHVIDLPPKEFGIDIERGFEPKYDVIKGKTRVLQDLKKTASEVDTVLLATDPDREGEAIAWHVANWVVRKGQPYYRVLINQITRDAVIRAVENKGELDLKKVNAQQARRVLDRLVGYKVSPVLWKTLYSGLSAGRVQSVALRLIVERDAEIEAFTPVEYWDIKALLATGRNEEFEAKLVKKGGKPVNIGNVSESEAMVRELSGASYSVKDVTKKKTKGYPAPPFITSTLQQDAARRLGFTVSRTMRIAQGLYEGIELAEGSVGLITYMRTDSTRIAPEALAEVRAYISEKWGSKELPAQPNIYKTKKSAQDAHEAVRPASFSKSPEKVKAFLTPEQFKLYSLIWNRFVASQMKPSESTVTTAEIAAGKYEFRASSTRIDYKGYLAVYEDIRQEDEEAPASALPESLRAGDALTLKKLTPSQHFTKPQAHFTEAALVKELETLGIGRPSTYAQIINTIQEREYVRREKGKLLATILGKDVNRLLVQAFPHIFNVDFTANMEEELDKVESGEDEWLHVVREFYKPFSLALENFTKQSKELKKSLIEETDEKCDKCGKPMIIRWGRNGRFMACSGFPACKNTRPLEQKEVSETTDEMCEKCGSPMEVKTGKYGKFFACSNYPACKNIKPYSLGVKCPVEGCKGTIVEKRSKKGKIFYSCNQYPSCKFASWNKPAAVGCTVCGCPTMIEGKNGEHTCPRCKSVGEAELIEK